MSAPPSSARPNEVVFELAGIHKSYGDQDILTDLNLSVMRGETLAVIGESGVGKTTCLKLMIGLLSPDAGEVRYLGQNIADMDQRRLNHLRKEVAYVFQQEALFDSLTVLDNLAFPLREHTKLDSEEIKRRASECLEMVGLNLRVLDQLPASLSGGMRKRVALARALMLEPKVVLYDDPLAGLDPQNITRIDRLILRLQRQLGLTSVIATHDMPTAFEVCDRIALLHDGHFAHVLTPSEMRDCTAPELRDFVAAGRSRSQRPTLSPSA